MIKESYRKEGKIQRLTKDEGWGSEGQDVSKIYKREKPTPERTKLFSKSVMNYNILIKLKTYIKCMDLQKTIKCQNRYKKK